MLLAFDLEGIAPGSGRDAAKAAAAFVNRLSPGDQVGVLSFPNGVSVEFTGDRERVAAALEKIVGRGTHMPMSIYTVGVQEAFDIEAGNTFALDRAVDRECVSARVGRQPRRSNGQPSLRDLCRPKSRGSAHDIAMTYRRRVEDVSRVFRTLLQQLKPIDAPKTVVWVSEGLPMPFDSEADLGQLSALAAAARVTALRDSPGPQFQLRRLERQAVADARWKTAAPAGWDSICSPECRAARSSRRSAPATTRSSRIAREMTAYYLLSAEPERQGPRRTHPQDQGHAGAARA